MRRPLRRSFSPITGRGFRVVSRQDGQGGRAGFCSRSPAEPARSASTAQVSGVEIPGPTRSASDRLDMRPGRPVAQSAFPPAPCRGSIVIARRCPERLTARRPVLLAARMLARNKFLYSFSRPALRAAACGGRPRAGSDTTATGEPASPFLPGMQSSHRAPARHTGGMRRRATAGRKHQPRSTWVYRSAHNYL
jgi:hypothetical protein